MASPLTNQFYLNRISSYGLHPNAARFSPEAQLALRVESGVPGLMLSGQDVTSPGFVPSLFAGVITAHVAAGYSLVDLLLGGRSLMRDLRNVPHPAAEAERQRAQDKRPPAVYSDHTNRPM